MYCSGIKLHVHVYILTSVLLFDTFQAYIFTNQYDLLHSFLNVIANCSYSQYK